MVEEFKVTLGFALAYAHKVLLDPTVNLQSLYSVILDQMVYSAKMAAFQLAPIVIAIVHVLMGSVEVFVSKQLFAQLGITINHALTMENR